MSKILIVEDEDAIRRVLKKVLSEENSKFIIDTLKACDYRYATRLDICI